MSDLSADDLQRVILLNAECFGLSDEYTDMDRLLSFLSLEDGHALVTRKDKQIVAYLLAKTTAVGVEHVRVGVTKSHRSTGLGLKLVRRLVKMCRDAHCRIDTYASLTNITSINLHLKAGMFIRSITPEWVNLEFDPTR
jgi:GNAT superfamily N-acetyltransferase